MEFDAHEVMARIAEQVARSGHRALGVSPAPQSAAAIRPSRTPAIAVKSEYTLPELLAYRDRAFVDTAFEVILKRKADATERTNYLEALRSGATSRIELLGALRWSPEGVAQGTHVDGLLVPYKLRRWSRIPWWGRPLGWLRSLFRLDVLFDRADADLASLAKDVTNLADGVDEAFAYSDERVRAVEDGLHALREHLQALATVREDVAARSVQFDAHEMALAEQAALVTALRTEFDGHVEGARAHSEARGAAWDVLVSRTTVLEQVAQDLRGQVHAVQLTSGVHGRTIDSVDARLLGLEHHIVAQGAAIELAKQQEASQIEMERSLDPLYVAFEGAFRGPANIIRERFAPYLDVIRSAGAGTVDRPLIDIGSGDGEWLQLVKDHGFIGSGVDTNRLFVELCRGRGLAVNEGDAIVELARMGEGTHGAVTAMHVAEHLPFSMLVRLIDESKRVLASGGALILETPNPENLRVGSHTFYLDPTHRNPLPPEMLRWMVAARGFIDVRIERMTTARDMTVPASASGDAPGAEAINTFVSMLSAAPDFAIIGRKP